MGEFPILIDGKKSIAGFFQDVGHTPGRFLQGDATLIALLQFADVIFGNRKANAQATGVEGLGQIIICARAERLLKVFGVGARRHQEDVHLVAVRLGA